MKMKKNLLIPLIAISIATMVCVVTVRNANASIIGEIRDEGDFEEVVFVPYVDLFYNSTGALSSVAGDDSYIIHSVFSFDLSDRLTEIYNAYSEMIFEFTEEDSFAGAKAYSDEESEDYGGFITRDVNPERSYNEYQLLSDGARSWELYNYSAIDDTTLPTSSSDEYIRPDSDTKLAGVSYEAADGQTPVQIGENIAAYDGYQFTELINFTVLFFAFDDMEDLTNLIVYFDSPIGSASGMQLNDYEVRRRGVQLFSRIKSTAQNKLVTIKNAFQRIGTNIISGLKELPVKATHFCQKTVGSAFHNLKIGVKAFAGGIWKAILTLVLAPTTLIIAAIFGVLWLRSRRR